MTSFWWKAGTPASTSESNLVQGSSTASHQTADAYCYSWMRLSAWGERTQPLIMNEPSPHAEQD